MISLYLVLLSLFTENPCAIDFKMDGCAGCLGGPGNGCHGQRGSSDALFSQLAAELYRRGSRLAPVCLSFPDVTLPDTAR